MRKIDVSKIRGKWQPDGVEFTEEGYLKVSGGAGDETEQSLKLLAEKLNEMVDWANNLDSYLIDD